MKKHILFSTAMLLLASCQQIQNQPHVYGQFNSNNKTIAVPAQGGCLNAAIKEELRKNQWQIKVAGATFDNSAQGHVNATAAYTAVITEGQCSQATPARWLYLFPLWGQIVWAINGCPPIFLAPVQYTTEANVTIFENKTGNELLTFYDRNVSTRKAAEAIQKSIRAHSAPLTH